MAVLCAKASGSFVTNTSWGLVAEASSSYLNAENGSEVLTTLYADTQSQAFTPGAITVLGIGVKLSVRTGVTGTMSVHLIGSVSGLEITGTEVTIDVADLPVAATADLNGGWIFFKFAAPVLLISATAYKLEAKTSSATQVSLFRNATADNLSRFLLDTSDNTPATGNDLIICGHKTGSGAETAITVTMDETAATDYGAASTSLITPSLAISDGGTLTYSTNIAAVLRQSGNVIVYSGGTLNIGTVATPVQRGKSAVLEFDCAADSDFGLTVRNLGTFTAQGLSRTVGKLIDRCLLNTAEAIASTSLGVDTDTGWLDNDEIVVASTTRTKGDTEKGTLNGNAGASTLTVDGFAGAGGGLAVAHSGTSPTQAEVILLTRNVRIRSTLSTAMSFTVYKATSIVDIDWTEFYYVGKTSTNVKAVDVQTTTGSFSMQFSSVHDTEGTFVFISGAASNNIVISNNVFYLNSSGNGIDVSAATTGTSITISNNIVMNPTTTGINASDLGASYSNNTVVGATTGFIIGEAAVIGTFSGNTAHSCSGDGLRIGDVVTSGTITDFTAWRCSGDGIEFNSLATSCRNIIFNGGTLFGNTTNNINIFGCVVFNIRFINYTLNGDTSFATTNGVLFADNASHAINLRFDNCDFSTVSGIKTAHTNDFNSTAGAVMIQAILRNTKLGASNEFNSQSALIDGSYIKSAKHDQTAAAHKSFFKYGTIQLDATTFHTAAPSEKLTPNNTTNRLESGIKRYAVASGGTITPSVWVRKSAAYDGAQPRLILKANPAAGIAADVVLDTMTVGVEEWELLTATSAAVTDDAVLEVCVDCILGTGGDVNVDDYS